MNDYEPRGLNELLTSIDSLFVDGKEQKLKVKLARQIKDNIFTDEIITKLNQNDFSGFTSGEDADITSLFSSIFPIFVKKDNFIFRLYKHKIEVDLSDEMSDRYIYMFSDGRLTSGIFQCFNISDNEYVYGVKRIIDAVPLFKKSIIETLENFQSNVNGRMKKINSSNTRKTAEKNYNELVKYLGEKCQK